MTSKSAELAEVVTLFKAEIRYPDIKPSADVQRFLEQSSDLNFLKGLNSLELTEYAVVLANYSIFITTQENRLKTYINYLESQIKTIVGKNVSNAAGYGFAEKDCYIRANETHAIALEEMKIKEEVKLGHLYFLSQKLQFLAECLKNYAYEKSRMSRMEI